MLSSPDREYCAIALRLQSRLTSLLWSTLTAKLPLLLLLKWDADLFIARGLYQHHHEVT